MSRPICCRRVAGPPRCGRFQPAGGPASARDEIVLAVDELEALRLADFEGLYQEEAGERMRVSRPTFGRIIESARKKVAQALVEGRGIRIEGGAVAMGTMRKFLCRACEHAWEVARGTDRPSACPKCASADIHRHPDDRGGCGRRGMGRGACGGRGHGRGPGAPAGSKGGDGA